MSDKFLLHDLKLTAIHFKVSLLWYFINLMMFQVLFQVNKRPDFETMKAVGKRFNNENQSTVGLELLKYLKEERDKLYYMGIMPAQEVN